MSEQETRFGTAEVCDPVTFKEALASYPSGVAIVTTVDADGVAHGFTASAFCSVSLEPPLVSVCLARTARCHPVFAARDTFAVNLLRPSHAGLAIRFARTGEDKFAGARFGLTEGGLPALDDALTVLECDAYGRHDAGDHTIIIGQVQRVAASDGEPLVYYRRAFHGVTGILR